MVVPGEGRACPTTPPKRHGCRTVAAGRWRVWESRRESAQSLPEGCTYEGVQPFLYFCIDKRASMCYISNGHCHGDVRFVHR